jgi:hypothetical protein
VIAMIVLAFLVVFIIGLILGALVGRAAGWHQGYDAALGNDGEELPENVSPFIRDARVRGAIEHWTGHHP